MALLQTYGVVQFLGYIIVRLCSRWSDLLAAYHNMRVLLVIILIMS
jgi:hypothetical protein